LGELNIQTGELCVKGIEFDIFELVVISLGPKSKRNNKGHSNILGVLMDPEKRLDRASTWNHPICRHYCIKGLYIKAF
jgi:hypothetical protein